MQTQQIDLANWVGTISGILSLVSVVYLASTRIAKLEVKVDTMWAFQMRRAISEVVEKDIGSMNSPLQFAPDAFDRLDPIASDLRDLWNQLEGHTSDAEALLKIEEKFGDALFNLVCVPCKLTHGACLILALAVAKGTMTVDITI